MKPDVDVSVIISTHNRAHYLDDALGALAAQNCQQAFEVIVIDNASTDDTAKVLDSWCRRDPRFRMAYEGRPGLSYGKNAGIHLARANLLLFTDDDTLVVPHWISAYLDLFARRGAAPMIAGGAQTPIPHDLRPWPHWFTETAIENLALLDHGMERPLAPSEYVWGANMAVPRRMFQDFGGWDERIGRKGHARGTYEDTEFQDRVRSAGVTVWFCPAAGITHRVARETLTPRRIFAAAFSRGRNQLWKQSQVSSPEVQARTLRPVVEVLLMLAANMLRWAFWVLAFRMVRQKAIFERARRAAYHCGRTLEMLHVGGSSLRLYEVVFRVVFGWRSVLLRLCSDSV